MYSFKPYPLLKNPHLQTIVASFYAPLDNPPSKTMRIPLPDGDILAIEISTPLNWKADDLTVLMVHGLAGSHESPYLKRMAHKYLNNGVRAIRINLRGCGSGEGLAQRGYHGGVSSDIFEVICHLKKLAPRSPFVLIGFSLGGNIVLKLAGEQPSLSQYLEKVIGICPSITLENTALRFRSFANRFYERSFLKYLKKLVHAQHQKFPSDLKKSLSRCRTLYEFDNVFTAPFWGFKDARDYYTKCSAQTKIPHIQLPTHILFAEDDPLIDPHALKGYQLPSNIEVLTTKSGGHMGFLGHPKHGSFRWMDDLIMHWTKNI